MAGQLLSDVSGYASTQFDSKIPALTDTADIQEAFSLYHYGLDNYDGSTAPAEDSIEGHFVAIDARITDIENTPTGGGIVQDEVPHLLVKEGGGTDSVPEGYIWVDGNGSVPSVTAAGVVSYINNEPSQPTHGQVWIDKDTDIAPVNISNYLSVSDAQETYLTQISGSASYLYVDGLTSTSASVNNLLQTEYLTVLDTATINNISVTGESRFNYQFNSQSASYQLLLEDHGRIIPIDNSSSNNLTVPANSLVPFPIGSTISIIQVGTGQTTIVPDSGVTIRSENNKLKTKAQYALVGIIKISTDEWVAFGNLTA